MDNAERALLELYGVGLFFGFCLGFAAAQFLRGCYERHR